MIIMYPISESCFCFIRKSMVGLGKVVGLAISRVVLMEINTVISFFRLFL